jgi:hypothetical protein
MTHTRCTALFFILSFVLAAALAWAQPAVRDQSKPSITGGTQDGIYRNNFLGFTYKLPYGWVDRTADMREGDDPGKLLLLAAFERPPEATGSTINSAVVVAAEKISSFSGLKTASDYFGPITELATAKGFSIVNEQHDFAVGTKRLVRADFSKPRGSLTMYQTSLVMLERGFAVSFTLIAGSTEEIAQLIERLNFAGRQQTKGRGRN